MARTRTQSQSLADVGAVLRMSRTARQGDAGSAQGQRQLVADLCKLFGEKIDRSKKTSASNLKLAPRVLQTLECLLTGDSEKQVAAKLKLSRHTVHVYVKILYKHFEVSSRGELLARWVDAGSVESRRGGDAVADIRERAKPDKLST